MKTVNARDLQKKIKECVDISQKDQFVITRRGEPAAGNWRGNRCYRWSCVVLATISRKAYNVSKTHYGNFSLIFS